MSDIIPEMTPRPWPPATVPSADEFLPWFHEQTTAAQTHILATLQALAAQGSRCRVEDHDGEIRRAHDRERVRVGLRDARD